VRVADRVLNESLVLTNWNSGGKRTVTEGTVNSADAEQPNWPRT